jgi:hypothetical protein
MRPAWLVLALGLAAPVAAGEREPAPLGSGPLARTAVGDSAFYAIRVLDQNLHGISITNYGFIGNNFTSRAPSWEYPLGTGYEHMVRAGLWFGAIGLDDNGVFTGVTTSAVDGAQGSAAASATEFTPVSDNVGARSRLPSSRVFTPAAVSELDLISTYDDGTPTRALSNSEDHRPLRIRVNQYNYSWSFSNYAHFVVFHYVIRNEGPPLRDAWVGLYAEMASGPKNAYSVWPPSSSGSTIGSWFNKKEVGYVDSLRLLTERFCTALPIPDGCAYSLAPPIMGMKLLGVRPGTLADTTDKRVTLQAWSYAPGNAARDEDVERYALMASGQVQPLSPLPDSLSPGLGDPVTLLAAGPFRQIDPGDSVEVDFVLIGALTHEELAQRAGIAQRAYELGYIVPVPPPSPRMRVVPRDGALEVYWDDSPESFEDPTGTNPRDFEGYRVYVGEDRNDTRRYAEFDLATAPNDTAGFNTGLAAVRLPSPEIIDGVPYHYRTSIRSLRNGFKYFVAVTAYDLGTSDIESLESGRTQNLVMAIPAPAPGERREGVTVFPNPYRVEAQWDAGTNVRRHYLWFANLPERARIRIYTLSGDLVYESDFDGRTYDGSNAQGIYNPATDLPATLSGALFGWDLITRQGQAAATGLYLWAVEDLADGEVQRGRLLIVKSDREGLR